MIDDILMYLGDCKNNPEKNKVFTIALRPYIILKKLSAWLEFIWIEVLL